MSGRLLRKWKLLGLGGEGADPYWTSVIMIVGFDTGTAVDESPTSKGLLVGGAGVVSTSSPLFGTHSLLNTTTSGYLNVAHAADLNFGTADFTVEFYFQPSTTTPGTGGWVRKYGGAGSRAFSVGNSGTAIVLTLSTDGTAIVQQTSANLTWDTNTVYHMCLQRSGTKIGFFRAGVLLAEHTVAGGFSMPSSTADMMFGDGTGLNMPGRRDEYRVTLVARYAAAGFTPPSTAFPRS